MREMSRTIHRLVNVFDDMLLSKSIVKRHHKDVNCTIKPFVQGFNEQNLIPFRRYLIMSAEMNKHGR